jgi:hypothetical protein
MTQQEARAEWIKRLRSGEIKQAKRVLGREDGSRCCLGVACDIAAEQGIVTKRLIFKNGSICAYNGHAEGVPLAAIKFFGLSSSEGLYLGVQSLANDNDSKYLTFAQIADIIESEPEGLFVKDQPSI